MKDKDVLNDRKVTLHYQAIGRPRVMRQCLGSDCTRMFLSTGPGNRFCTHCDRVRNEGCGLVQTGRVSLK